MLNPSYPLWAAAPLRDAYFMAGHYENVLRVVARKPDESLFRNDLVMRAASYGALGRAKEAKAAVGAALARIPDLSIEGYAAACR